MSNNIIDFIKKQGTIFDAAKYFGGIDKLRDIANTNNELKTLIDKNSKGWLDFKARGKSYKFNFYILDYDIEDAGWEENDVHVYLLIDLTVDYPNLSPDELLTIGKWAAEFCEDNSLNTVSTPDNLLSEDQYGYYMVTVKKINGQDVPWVPHKLLDDQDSIIQDETAEKLIGKSKSGKESVTESLIRLQNLFGKVF